jgi:hypothetical protein
VAVVLRRIVRGIAVVGVLSSAIVLACGFPDPVLLDLSSEGGATSSSGGQQPDATIDGRLPDGAPILPDGDPGVDVNPCPAKPNPCDCDEDGFLAKRCGGDDCDDFDLRAKPDAGFRSDPPSAGSNGDWNCNGTPERQERTEFTAAGCNGLVKNLCNDSGGYTLIPGCGTVGKYIKCSSSGPMESCIAENLRDLPVACK